MIITGLFAGGNGIYPNYFPLYYCKIATEKLHKTHITHTHKLRLAAERPGLLVRMSTK